MKDENMVEYEFSEHAADMLQVRIISKDWIARVVNKPDTTEEKEDGTLYFIRAIPEFGGRYLRVVTNPRKKPMKIITAFFDRKLGRKP